jgi:tetratricopeptide (TPR) repeat protein
MSDTAPPLTKKRAAAPVVNQSMAEVIVAGLIGIIVVAIYAQVGGHRTIWDDSLYLTDNLWVRRGLTWEGVVWAFTNVDAANWHPVTWLSHMIDQKMFGALIGGHMIGNPFWHVGNSFLVYRLLVTLGTARMMALGLALLFAAHPLNVESVAWLSQRKTQISTFMLLATVLVYLEWRVTRKPLSRVLLTAAYAISLMAKAMGVTLPVILFALELAHQWPQLRADVLARSWRSLIQRIWGIFRELWPLVAAAALVAVATFFAQRQSSAVVSLADISVEFRVVNAFAAVGIYLRTFFWPSELCLFYPLSDSTPWDAGALGFLAIAVGTLLAIYGSRRNALVAFGWIWFLVALLPVIGLVQVGSQSHADRYMYVPMIGLLIAAGAWLEKVRITGCRRPVWAWRALVFAFALGMAPHAYAYTMLWRDGETAYRRSLQVGGFSFAMAANLAATLTNLHYYKTAEVYSALCAQEWPDIPLVSANRAYLLRLMGRHSEAEAAYRRAIELEPKNVKHHYMFGLLLLEIGKNEEADAALNEALRLLPPEGDWRVDNSMIARALRREVSMAEVQGPEKSPADAANPAAQPGSK